MATSFGLNLKTGLENCLVHVPKWDIPKHVKALVTTRQGGQSHPPYNHWNLALHVDDEVNTVTQNRQLLSNQIGKEAFFLNQVHGTDVFSFTSPTFTFPNDSSLITPEADGVITSFNSHFLAILTADCLPILLCDAKGDVIAACHAGWRGLANGVIDKTIQAMVNFIQPDSAKIFIEGLHVYIGPAISQSNYEVGEEVRDTFSKDSCFRVDLLDSLFTIGQKTNKYYADLFGLATEKLNHSGIYQVHTEKLCSYNQSEYFYSYRREKITGRFASCIWLE
jgi:YfiH family protein